MLFIAFCLSATQHTMRWKRCKWTSVPTPLAFIWLHRCVLLCVRIYIISSPLASLWKNNIQTKLLIKYNGKMTLDPEIKSYHINQILKQFMNMARLKCFFDRICGKRKWKTRKYGYNLFITNKSIQLIGRFLWFEYFRNSLGSWFFFSCFWYP